MKQTKSSKIVVISIICATVAVIAVVGGLIYMQKQSIAQKDREFHQQKQLKEYEQEQINARNKADNIEKCRAAAAASSNPFDGVSCNKD